MTLDDLEAMIGSRGRRLDNVHELLAGALTGLAVDYDLVVLDIRPPSPSCSNKPWSPPGGC